jgi:hypothetical protein
LGAEAFGRMPEETEVVRLMEAFKRKGLNDGVLAVELVDLGAVGRLQLEANAVHDEKRGFCAHNATRLPDAKGGREQRKRLQDKGTENSQEMVDMQQLAGNGGNADRFLDTAFTVTRRRRYFTTASGLYGIGPDIMAKGDVLCVLYGARMPFILRPVNTEGSRFYQVIGECYVRDIMRGEAITLLERSKQVAKAEILMKLV